MPSKSPHTPKDLKIKRRPIQIGDTLMLPVTVTGMRPMRAKESAVEYNMVSLRIPGFKTPVTIPADFLKGEGDA